jgi:hypothetical protein
MHKMIAVAAMSAGFSLAACGRDPGPKGDPGAQGPAGPQGAQGKECLDHKAPPARTGLKARRVRRKGRQG